MIFDPFVATIFDPAVAMIFDHTGINKFDPAVIKDIRPPRQDSLTLRSRDFVECPTHFDPSELMLRRLF
jgi:hypothetical protein